MSSKALLNRARSNRLAALSGRREAGSAKQRSVQDSMRNVFADID